MTPSGEAMAEPDDSALPSAVRERIARYETRATRLEATLADYRRRQPMYRKVFAAMLVTAVACFGIGRLPGLWATISAIVICGGGYVMLLGRLWEVQADVTATRQEIANLRRGTTALRGR
ncbi:MAG: hypothetical protein Q8S73_00920 [Deltaproteobacteria bacterium]|nr:hypothetical protein [Myxococcales bacterium]MDP3212636.1 hypothetical protein [Deltaproteobacteria bacterium]